MGIVLSPQCLGNWLISLLQIATGLLPNVRHVLYVAVSRGSIGDGA